MSIKESNYSRVEIKNITGFKEIESALFFEVERQQLVVQEGRDIVNETRGWDAAKGLTYPMRLKETEADYGYIIDPDLVPIDLDISWVDQLRKDVPELADEKTDRFTQLGVDPIDAEVLAQNKDIAELFDQVSKHIKASEAAKWIRREVMRVLNFAKKDLRDSKIGPDQIIDILHMIQNNQITENTAQKLMEEIVDQDLNIKIIVEERGLASISDESAIKEMCEQIIKEQSQAVEDYKTGNEKTFNFLVGQVMRLTKGKASPDVIKSMMKELLS